MFNLKQYSEFSKEELIEKLSKYVSANDLLRSMIKEFSRVIDESLKIKFRDNE